MDVAVITSVRNDDFFLSRWIDYYGSNFGHKNLYVILDGQDQPTPDHAPEVNTLTMPRKPLERVPAMRRRARLVSDIARGLFRFYDVVIAGDVDEFIIPDPDHYPDLRTFIEAHQNTTSSISGLGLDVGQHIRLESELDPSKKMLDQRRFAHLSSRYTKPSISYKPCTWGSGFHRIKRQNFHISDKLYDFHFGMIDYARSTGKTADKDRLATGWGGHLERRERLFKIIDESTPMPGDDYFPTARRLQTWRRPWFAWNKPAMIKGDPVIEIPERFRGII
ncbi:glycosyltransferase family 2 protein [Aliiroseovarius sp.]|uniref:glycosyltransferase family 2 protein n=1 Tax=Aliiroseovarius sp. TaxID=1872442 RepID=UPI003BA86C03